MIIVHFFAWRGRCRHLMQGALVSPLGCFCRRCSFSFYAWARWSLLISELRRLDFDFFLLSRCLYWLVDLSHCFAFFFNCQFLLRFWAVLPKVFGQYTACKSWRCDAIFTIEHPICIIAFVIDDEQVRHAKRWLLVCGLVGHLDEEVFWCGVWWALQDIGKGWIAAFLLVLVYFALLDMYH